MIIIYYSDNVNHQRGEPTFTVNLVNSGPLCYIVVGTIYKCPDQKGVHSLGTLLYITGITGNALIREVSLFQRSLIETFHCSSSYSVQGIGTVVA